MKRSHYYHIVAQDLDILADKSPEDIYKTHLADVYSANIQNIETDVKSSKDTLSCTLLRRI